MAKVLKKRSEALLPVWKLGMNPEQLAAIEHGEGPARLLAAAGSGKTRVVTHRIARLIESGVAPERILALTFSKKAADEMAERVRKLDVDGVRVATWHSLCLQILREDRTRYREWTIRESTKLELKDVVGWRGMDWKGVDVNALSSFIGRCKANLFAPDSAGAAELANKTFGFNYARAIKAFHLYNEKLEEKEILSMDDFLVFAADHLADENNRASWAAKFDYVIQDEAQDENQAQKHIAHELAKDHRNYMVVGDVYQCHPPGVLVDLGEGRSLPIETLRDGDVVRSWNRQSQKMVGGRRVKIASRPYNGRMFAMTASERTVDMTPNHRVLARWTDRGAETCVTYLMWREGFGYRVGWCQLFNRQGANHFVHRVRLEKADKAWILGVHDDRTEASLEESIVAAKYGLPTSPFEPVLGARHITKEVIGRLFDAVRGENEERGERALADFQRYPEFPMYPWLDEQSVKRTYFECFACNLIPGLMSVPLPDATNAWTPIEGLTSRPYKGPVYSLDVERDHSYSANGIVVLNSIYGFRGSTPEYLAKFEEEWPGAVTYWLPRNYRSTPEIVRAANGIVSKARVEGIDPQDMVAERKDAGEVRALASETLDDEANNFVGWIKKRVDAFEATYSDFTALFRTNAQSRALEEALLGSRIPYVVVGGTSFYERKEVRDLLAYLRLANGTGELDDVKRCINAPFRFLGAKFVEKISDMVDNAIDRGADQSTLDWVKIVQAVADGGERIQARQRESAFEWARMIHNLRLRIESKATDERAVKLRRPSVILEDVLRETKYLEWITKEEGEESIETSGAANVREMVRVSERFPSVPELLGYVEQTIKASRRQREDKQAGGDRVLLMSVHRSKGLEWPHVWVAGCNEMILPHPRGDAEEERRLAYVAATRARDSLVLSYVRTVATRAGIKDAAPSRFIRDSGVPLDGEEEDVPPEAVSIPVLDSLPLPSS